MIALIQNFENQAQAIRQGWSGESGLVPTDEPDLEATILAMVPEEE